ncbi:hypothetical protein D3C77_648780 [compost metagenome]
MTTGVLAQYELTRACSYCFWLDDLICASVLEHTVLMNAGFMSKGVCANNRFVTRNAHTRHFAYHTTGSINFTQIQ